LNLFRAEFQNKQSESALKPSQKIEAAPEERIETSKPVVKGKQIAPPSANRKISPTKWKKTLDQPQKTETQIPPSNIMPSKSGLQSGEAEDSTSQATVGKQNAMTPSVGLTKMNISCSAVRGSISAETIVGVLVYTEDNEPVADANVVIKILFGSFRETGSDSTVGKTDPKGVFKAVWSHPGKYYREDRGYSLEIKVSASKHGFQKCSGTCSAFYQF